MTNPTRTRAEILEEIANLKEELDEAWPKEGHAVWLQGVVRQLDEDTVDVEVIGDRGEICRLYYSALIPAADLIPREEHERALAEAKETGCLKGCRVTVERIDTDHIGGSAEMVPDAVAATTSHGTAVAPKGVVQELYYLSNEMNMSDAQGWAWLVDKAVDRITELPEPNVNLVSYTAKDRVVRVVSLSGWYISLQDSNEALQLAANCIKAAELLREAKRDGEGER